MARRILCRRASLRRPRTPCELAAAVKGTPPYPRPCRGLGIRRDHQALDAPLGGQDGAVEQVGATVRAGRAPRVRVEPSWPGRSSGGKESLEPSGRPPIPGLVGTGQSLGRGPLPAHYFLIPTALDRPARPVDFFSRDDLPPLSVSRTNRAWLLECFAH